MSLDTQGDALLQRFRADGFVAIRQFIVGDELQELIGHVDRFIKDVVPRVPRVPSDQVFYEDKRNPDSLKQIQHMVDHDAWFGDLFTAGRFRQVAERMVQGPVVPKNMQYFNKPPGIGKPTPAHQDGHYFMLDPCIAVTIWFALDNADEETGCVRYVRGSHTRPMRQHARTQTLGFSHGIVDYPTDEDRQRELAVAAQAGDLVVHDALTIHRADGNQSATRSRRALGFIYYGQQAREDTEAHAAYQRKLAKQMKEAGNI